MGLGIEEILKPALRDRSVRFVFPSEICAEAWLAGSLRMGVGAIETDRFLGWDRLKEEAARVDGRPASDDHLRSIFAANLLAENAAESFLSVLIPPAFAQNWPAFAGHIASRLPALARLPDAMRDTRRAAMMRGDPAAADWLAIRERYVAFLDRTGCFESAYEPRTLRALAGNTVVFFPELIEDFEEYRATLEGAPGVTLVGLPAGQRALEGSLQGTVRLSRPETALAELRQVLSEVGELLDSGVEAERIAITVADLDRYRPYLEREATLVSLPLALRSGKNLAATGGGRLLTALRELYSSGFSYDALRDLTMSPAWPWKETEVFRDIMAEGLRLHAVASWPVGGRTIDAWESSLGGSLLSTYRRLKSRTSAIATAKDFSSLLKAYNAFKAEFLSPDRELWNRDTDLSLARCVVELQGLVRAQSMAGLEVSGAFGLFMRSLDSTPYVSTGSGGVPVYAWRVAAGICPERHFILNASQDALALPSRGFDYLGPALRKKLGGPSENADAAPAFIRAYALSGDSVSFSCPRAGFGGDVAAHGFLVSLSDAEGTEGSSAEGPCVQGTRDPAYQAEAAWLSGRGPAPTRLHRTQALGLAAAALAPPSAARGDGAFLTAATAALSRTRLFRKDDPRAGMDATAIDAYHSCPYAYLYLRLLDAGPEASGIAFADALFMGEVYHEVLARLFERIRELDGRFKAERADDYRGLVGACLDEAFTELARKRGAFVGVVLETYRNKLERNLQNLVTVEAERFPSLEISFIEKEFELDYPELVGGVVLRGRVDRVSRSEKGAIIIDYKKAALPAKALVAPDAESNIAKAQIPCYLRLVGATGQEIDSAWYISIEGDSNKDPGRAVCAFGASGPASVHGNKTSYVPEENLEAFLDAFDAALRVTAQGIFAGAFPLAPKETQADVCQDCGARGICRERYALRFGVVG